MSGQGSITNTPHGIDNLGVLVDLIVIVQYSGATGNRIKLPLIETGPPLLSVSSYVSVVANASIGVQANSIVLLTAGFALAAGTTATATMWYTKAT